MSVACSLWNGYKRLDFSFKNRDCILILPDIDIPRKNWIWRTEFFNSWPAVDLELLSCGFHLAYINVQNMYGAPEALDVMDDFYLFLRSEYGLSEKTALEGFSRGGLFAFNWAIRHPEYTACIYADAPVCDIRSWPGGFGIGPGSSADWEKCLKIYNKNETQILSIPSPIDHLAVMADASVPIIIVAGACDEIVPITENTLVVAERYSNMGGPVKVIIKPFGLHHPHSLENPAPIVDFILDKTGSGLRKPWILPDPKIVPYGYDYYQIRDGLANSYSAFTRKKKGRIAFLGGSITHMQGWSNLITEALQKQFPDTDLEFINAGVPSIDSTFHAFRYCRDVLKNGPVDLLFVEAAVNDSTNGRTACEMLRGMEGIIRRARMDNPSIDILMLHFADPDKLSDYRSGRKPLVITQHEKAAVHYNIPSLDLACEICERIAAGEFSWDKDFKDLHPSLFGHKIYASSILRVLDACWSEKNPHRKKNTVYTLPEALDRYSYYKGTIKNISDIAVDDNWKYIMSWQPHDQAAVRPGFTEIPVLESAKTGALLTVPFTGTGIGILILSGPECGKISYSIDNGLSGILNLFTKWSHNLHLPWTKMLACGIPPGKHILRLKLMTGTIRIVNFLINDNY